MEKGGLGEESRVADERGAAAAARRALKLVFKHDPDLPISAKREAIMEALRRSQVLIVAGDTGSGKSPQLPPECLELGRGTDPLIAPPHPRRPAAPPPAPPHAPDRGAPGAPRRRFRVAVAGPAPQ